MPTNFTGIFYKVVLSIVGFFAIQFYLEVRQISKDVNTALKAQGVILERIENRGEKIAQMEQTISDLESETEQLKLKILKIYAIVGKEEEEE